jgi:hypothetical protein
MHNGGYLRTGLGPASITQRDLVPGTACEPSAEYGFLSVQWVWVLRGAHISHSVWQEAN